MAAQQHLYRRGAIYWWRHLLPITESRSYDARVSLRTASKNQARARAGYLTALAGSGAMTTMLEEYAAKLAVDSRITHTQLKAIYRTALDEGLAQFIGQQDSLSQHGAINRQLNEAAADSYQWLYDTDGRTATVSDEYARRLEARDYDPERIERLRLAVATHAERQAWVNPRTIEVALEAAGIPLNDTTYRRARREIWLAYRDAARETEVARLHRAGVGPAPEAGVRVPEPNPVTVAPSECSVGSSMTVKEALESCRQHSMPKDGTQWASEVQVRTAMTLLMHVTGESLPIRELTQKHIGDCANLMLALPNRWGRTSEELKYGIPASLRRAADLPQTHVGLGKATQSKHFTWIKKVIEHGSLHGEGPRVALKYKGSEKADGHNVQTKRNRDKRAVWSKDEINQLLKAPIFTGCEDLLDTHRLRSGRTIYHDGWYFASLLLIHLGGRSAEIVGLPICDVHDDAVIPFIDITFSEDRRIKNIQSQRKLPIHPELLRLGFKEYVEAIRATGEKMLFPEFASPDSKSFASTFYKKVFAPWRQWAFPNGTSWRHGNGGAVKDKDVYSFRGRAATEMRNGRVAKEIIADILGHEQETTAAQWYLEPTPLAEMLEAMAHTTHLTAEVVAHRLNMRPSHLRRFGSTAAKGGRPKKETA